jgi:hypothetical protein
MKARDIREKRITTVVTAHGRERLLKGLLARFSFVAINFSPESTNEAYTPQLKGRN